MTIHLVLSIFLLQGLWSVAQGWCFYNCPKSSNSETVCAVDSKRGAKLFHGKCQIWKENYCQTTEYQEMDMQQCLDLHPEVVYDFLATNRCVLKYEKLRNYFGVRPFRRFFLLINLISRMALPPPPRMPSWPSYGQSQMPFPMWPPVPR